MNSQKGYIVSLIMFFVMVIMLSTALTMTFLVINRQKNIINIIKSTQAYYASESGIEDALIKLKKTPQMSPVNYDLNVNGVTTSIVVPGVVGGSRVITSNGDNSGIIRKSKINYSIDSGAGTSFYYGAQAGAGGLQMENGSRVKGNVFSGGNVSGNGTIDNDLIVSGNNHSISGVLVKGNAMAYSCLSGATINGNLTYVTGGTRTCTVNGAITTQPNEIALQPLPIPQSQIDEWKTEAAVQVFTGNKTISGTQNLGPIKITGNLTISNNAILNMTGIVYVVGNIYINNNAIIRLDSSYGTLGGVILADGLIRPSNNSKFYGSGQTSSYLLILSTSTANNAILLNNNMVGGVFYTSAGGLEISNNVSVVEATGYKIIMQQNSTIQYSSGLVNIYFASGPGGSWKVSNWQEY